MDGWAVLLCLPVVHIATAPAVAVALVLNAVIAWFRSGMEWRTQLPIVYLLAVGGTIWAINGAWGDNDFYHSFSQDWSMHFGSGWKAVVGNVSYALFDRLLLLVTNLWPFGVIAIVKNYMLVVQINPGYLKIHYSKAKSLFKAI